MFDHRIKNFCNIQLIFLLSHWLSPQQFCLYHCSSSLKLLLCLAIPMRCNIGLSTFIMQLAFMRFINLLLPSQSLFTFIFSICRRNISSSELICFSPLIWALFLAALQQIGLYMLNQLISMGLSFDIFLIWRRSLIRLEVGGTLFLSREFFNEQLTFPSLVYKPFVCALTALHCPSIPSLVRHIRMLTYVW